MGTRCGQIDPGVLIYLMQQRGLSIDQVEDLLYNHSGLKGLSGVSNDMRDLLESNQPGRTDGHRLLRPPRRPRAGLAGRGARGPGRAGVHRRHRRALPRDPRRVCRDADWLGVALDDEANRSGGPRISKEECSPSVWAIPTNEELMIARHTLRLICASTSADVGGQVPAGHAPCAASLEGSLR